MKDISNNDIK